VAEIVDKRLAHTRILTPAGHHCGMDIARVVILREALATTGWVEASQRFASSLRRLTRTAGGLLLVGPPDAEPWHLAAHLDDEARYSGIPELSPILVRWRPPAGAPPHLAVGLRRIEATRRGETLFVVTADEAPPQLLERVWDARRLGATVMALDGGDRELESLAHDALSVPEPASSGLPAAGPAAPAVSFDLAQHLVSAAVGDIASAGTSRPGLRERLARLLDAISGPAR
jgi:hypothetical protein